MFVALSDGRQRLGLKLSGECAASKPACHEGTESHAVPTARRPADVPLLEATMLVPPGATEENGRVVPRTGALVENRGRARGSCLGGAAARHGGGRRSIRRRRSPGARECDHGVQRRRGLVDTGARCHPGRWSRRTGCDRIQRRARRGTAVDLRAPAGHRDRRRHRTTGERGPRLAGGNLEYRSRRRARSRLSACPPFPPRLVGRPVRVPSGLVRMRQAKSERSVPDRLAADHDRPGMPLRALRTFTRRSRYGWGAGLTSTCLRFKHRRMPTDTKDAPGRSRARDAAGSERAPRCACGMSKTMPYCDGTHMLLARAVVSEPTPTGDGVVVIVPGAADASGGGP